jgi:UDP-N-acetyl-2-amino-2-deoxyglucuronate dehydrogenase
MRIGIVGAGNISGTHARAARDIPGLTVAAIYGENRERAARLASEHGAAAFDDFDRFLTHPLDLVAIGSPSGLHAEQGIAAAQRGLHVLVEKPIDVTVERADALIAATDAAGVRLGVFFQDRLRPEVTRLKRMLDAGELGAPVMISGRVKWYRPREYYANSRWRGTWALDGGGALMNQGIHTVDLIQWFFGPVTRVQGSVATRLHDIEVEDTAAAVLEFTSGALGVIEAATSIHPGYARRLEVTGTKGTVVLEDSNPSMTSPVVADVSGHQHVLEDFIRAIQTSGSPACDGREARKSVEIVKAIYAAAGQTSNLER